MPVFRTYTQMLIHMIARNT